MGQKIHPGGLRVGIGKAHRATLVDAQRDRLVEDGAKAGHGANAHGERVGNLVADDFRAVSISGCARKNIARLDGKAGGLQVAVLYSLFAHRFDDRGHGLVVGVQRGARRIGLAQDGHGDGGHVRCERDLALAGHGDAGYGFVCHGRSGRGKEKPGSEGKGEAAGSRQWHGILLGGMSDMVAPANCSANAAQAACAGRKKTLISGSAGL